MSLLLSLLFVTWDIETKFYVNEIYVFIVNTWYSSACHMCLPGSIFSVMTVIVNYNTVIVIMIIIIIYLTLGSGRALGGGNGNPLQYSYLETSMDRGALWAAVHDVAKSWTQLK